MEVLRWMLTVLLIFAFVLTVGLCLRYAKRQIPTMVNLAAKYKLLPRRWLVFVFFPLIGKKIFASVHEKVASTPIYLKLSSMRSSEINPSPVPLGASNWFLFEEQYDRKTSAHHGTKITLLNKKRSYRFVTSFDLTGEFVDEGTILVETPRPLLNVTDRLLWQDEILWANLHCGDDTSSWWILENLSTGTVIPIVFTRKGKKDGKMITVSTSDRLESQDKFCIGLSEFQIVCLPNLFVHCSRTEPLEERYSTKDIHKDSVSINGEITFGSGHNNYFRAYTDTVPRVFWRIVDGVLTVLSEGATLEYTSVVDGMPVDCEPGSQIFLMPGDRFRVAMGSDFEYRFRIDYLRE